MMHFPMFQIFPLFSKHFQTLWKLFICSRKDFHPPKFLMTFFSHRPQISNFLSYFPCFSTLPPPVSRKLLFPHILKCPHPVLEKFTCFLHTLCVFCFPPTLTMMHLCITQCT